MLYRLSYASRRKRAFTDTTFLFPSCSPGQLSKLPQGVQARNRVGRERTPEIYVTLLQAMEFAITAPWVPIARAFRVMGRRADDSYRAVSKLLVEDSVA